MRSRFGVLVVERLFPHTSKVGVAAHLSSRKNMNALFVSRSSSENAFRKPVCDIQISKLRMSILMLVKYLRAVRVLVVLFWLAVATASFAQSYGPPGVGDNWQFYAYVGPDDQGRDLYSAGSATLTIDSSYYLDDGFGGQYDPVNHVFVGVTYPGGPIALSVDGSDILGPPGVEARGGDGETLNVNMGGSYLRDFQCNSVVKWTSISNGQIFQIAATAATPVSPWYRFDASASNFVVIYSGTSWTPTNLTPPLPGSFYVDGRICTLTGESYGGDQYEDYWVNLWYSDWMGNSWFVAYGVSGGSSYGYITDPIGSAQLSVDPSTWQISNVPAGQQVSFAPPSTSSPTYGPPVISWNEQNLPWSYSDSQGSDVYSNSDSTMQVVFTATNTFIATDLVNSNSGSGWYDTSVDRFYFSDGAMANFLALDSAGNPLDHTGVLFKFGSDGQAGAVIARDGRHTPTYRFQFGSGYWGVEYFGLNPGEPFIVQDSSGDFSSPTYSSGSSGLVIDTLSAGWPGENICPQTLYVNGWPVEVASSTHSGNADPAIGTYLGSATYASQTGGPSVVLSWTWSDTFHGWAVAGSYGVFGSFTGHWDGVALAFTGLPPGLSITLNPIIMPHQGPAQIDWNGVTLIWDPIASAVSASNPTGQDIYHDDSGLGLRAVINPNGSVTLTQSGGATLTGTYNVATSAFTFDSSAGSVYAMNSQGIVIQPGSGGSSGQNFDLFGNLDIQGNLLSFGNWTNTSGSSAAGLLFTFTDETISSTGSVVTPALLNSASLRAATVFSWSHATSDGSSTQKLAMQLDENNRLLLFNPASSTSPPPPSIVLDPNGTSHINTPIVIAPQGDIDMGIFQAGPMP